MSPGSRPSRGPRSFLGGWPSHGRTGRAISASRGSPGPRIEPVESAMLRAPMSLAARWRLVSVLVVVAVTLSACGGTSLRQPAGLAQGDDPTIEIKGAEAQWVLIKKTPVPGN